MTRPLALSLILSFALITSASASRSTTGYGVILTPLTTSTRTDGTGTVFSMSAAGDLRGLVTVDLGQGSATGKWTFMVAYVQDFNPDGTPALTPPVSEEDEAAHPTVMRQVTKGALTGTIAGASIGIDASGRKVLSFAQLTITGGSLTFAGASGTGTIAMSTLPDGTSTTNLSLIF